MMPCIVPRDVREKRKLGHRNADSVQLGLESNVDTCTSRAMGRMSKDERVGANEIGE